jgi:thiol-disulfide isomerase/thioredoxin
MGRRAITRIFTRNLFLGVGAGMVIMILIPLVGGYLFIGWYSGEHMPGGEKILEGSVDASPSPSAVSADYDWTIQSLDGQDFKMANAKGKVVFLNFWATWCSPCVAEMASIQRLYEKLKDKGVVFACISNEETSKVSRFVRRKGYTFPIYTMRGSPPAVFNTQRVPTTFMLSRDGRIALKHIGSAKWDDHKSVDVIKGLMK